MTISSNDLLYLRTLVRKRTAIALEADKDYLVEARLTTLAASEGFQNLTELLRKARSDGAVERKIVEAILTNETLFFRDLHPFNALTSHVIPSILASRNGAPFIWCAACSSGQEAYSIAILVREHFPTLSGIKILATDLSAKMLGRAREGRYGQLEVNRGLPAPLLVKYFKQVGINWQVSDEIRQMIEWRELNLAEPWAPFPLADILFLRNVLIYFPLETKRQILARVRRQLHPGGYLFLGAAETIIQLDDGLESLCIEKTPCYRLRKGP